MVSVGDLDHSTPDPAAFEGPGLGPSPANASGLYLGLGEGLSLA